jgi:hypothetical protein
LASAGLIPERCTMNLGEFIDSYIAGRADVKKSTSTNFGIAKARVVEFFGANRSLGSITEGDADAWLVHLKGKFAQATVSKTVKWARLGYRLGRACSRISAAAGGRNWNTVGLVTSWTPGSAIVKKWPRPITCKCGKRTSSALQKAVQQPAHRLEMNRKCRMRRMKKPAFFSRLRMVATT